MPNSNPRRRYELAKHEAPAGCELEQFLETDNAFVEGVTKANMAVIPEQHGLENVRSL